MKLTYWVGLQDGEVDYTMTCGCVLTMHGTARYEDGCDVALFVCPLHRNAEALLDAARMVLTAYPENAGLTELREIVDRIGVADAAEDQDEDATEDMTTQG
jgi:hypothetical protein